jgi:hypothetical protein
MDPDKENLYSIGYYYDPAQRGFSRYLRDFPHALRMSFKLSRVNRYRYSKRAEKLLNDGSLIIRRWGTLVRFDFEDKYVNMSVSENKGADFQKFIGLPCVGKREERVETLIDFFGRSSAIVWAAHLPFLRKRKF